MPRIIRYYAKLDETLAGEHPLPMLDLAQLQDIFKVTADNPMYDSFPVGEAQAKAISIIEKLNFDFKKFDYFLDYED